ncbi:transposable element Tcb1 transposase [Trichonephila clavipes]|nr:transposable element Tcb1 transposase [Trichonephila clavipes]
MKEGCGWQNGMKLSLLTSHASVCKTTMVGFESGDTVVRGCIMRRHSGLAPGIMLWGGIGYHSHTPVTFERITIVRVHYFVRGGFVGYRSRASSKHLSLSSSGRVARFLGGQTGVALDRKLHVWASNLQRNRHQMLLLFWRRDVTARPLLWNFSVEKSLMG